jgi:glucosyl-dolichyl phosphate glucuronosyltransferase
VRVPAGVSVIVCAYTERRWDELVAAVASVADQSRAALETVVVCDHNPTLHERVRQQLPDVIVVPNREARGLSGARNSGVSAARGDVVAFLDDDAVAAPDWLESLLAPYADPSVIGVGGAIEPDWADRRPRFLPDEFDWVVGCTYRGMPAERGPVRNLIGANMSLRRTVLEAVGGFRTDVGRIGTRPLGCEETELCIRARHRLPGRELIYEPRARVRHRVPPERAEWAYFRARCWSEGLSKAMVTRSVGGGDGLASERRYMTSVLPRAAARGVAEALTGDASGLARTGSILAGVSITTAGYAIGALRGRVT